MFALRQSALCLACDTLHSVCTAEQCTMEHVNKSSFFWMQKSTSGRYTSNFLSIDGIVSKLVSSVAAFIICQYKYQSSPLYVAGLCMLYKVNQSSSFSSSCRSSSVRVRSVKVYNVPICKVFLAYPSSYVEWPSTFDTKTLCRFKGAVNCSLRHWVKKIFNFPWCKWLWGCERNL